MGSQRARYDLATEQQQNKYYGLLFYGLSLLLTILEIETEGEIFNIY